MEHHEIEKTVRRALADLTQRDVADLATDQDLGDAIGLDSLGRLELLAEVEDRFDIFFADADIEDAATIADMVGIVQRALAEATEAA